MSGLYTAATGITLTPTEIAQAAAGGEDLVGMLQSVAQLAADGQAIINAMTAKMPSGSNKTTLTNAITNFLS